jgi:hypothetical protein
MFRFAKRQPPAFHIIAASRQTADLMARPLLA